MKIMLLRATILVVLFFIPKMVFGNVVINEIMYDLEIGADGGREWVEVLNNSDTSVDLTGWKIFEEGTNHKLTLTQGNISLSPNGYAIIADNSEKFLLDNPSYSGTLFDSAFSLSNSGENLALKNKDLTIVEEVNYTSSWGANGNGRTLQRENPNGATWGSGNPTPGAINNISPEEPASESEESTTEQPETPLIPTGPNSPPIADAGDNIIGFINQEISFTASKSSDPENNELHYEWNMGDGKLIEKPSFAYKYFYPGTYLVTLMVYDGQYYVSDTITVKIQAGQITINEFLANPSGKDEEEEWIEIYNDSDSIVNISNWQLDDAMSGSEPFVFPKNSLIAPKSYLVFPRQITGIALNNDKDSVRLLLPEGVVFQEITYEKPPLGKSSARTDEGFVWSTPTPGMANIISPSNASGLINKEFIYQQPIEPETTKEPLGDYVINYQNSNKPEIEGGYTIINPNDKELNPQTNNLATIKQPTTQNPLNLIFLVIAVTFGSGFIGLLLVKFHKRKPFAP